MGEKWNIIYYENLHGKSQVYDFIEDLEPKAQAKISNTFDLLEQYGTNFGLPHVKKLSEINLWELRILGKNNIRIFYVSFTSKIFLLLHAFVKKKQKTNKREIKIALERLREYKNRKKLFKI